MLLALSELGSSVAPAFTSSRTTFVLPLLTAIINAESPSCVMTDMCSETLMTSQKGSSHTRSSLQCDCGMLIYIVRNTGNCVVDNRWVAYGASLWVEWRKLTMGSLASQTLRWGERVWGHCYSKVFQPPQKLGDTKVAAKLLFSQLGFLLRNHK